MKNKYVLSIMAGVLLLASTAMAYNIEITPGGSTDITGSSFFDVSIVFNPDPGGNTFGTFGFNLFYDTSELTYSDYQLLFPSPIGPAVTPPSASTAGKINNLSGFLPFGQSAPTISSPYTLAKITFGLVNPSSDGAADVWFDTKAGTGFTVNNTFTQMSSITREGAPDISGTPSIVPEPLSSILFAAGGGTFLLRRFVKNSRQKI
jgi:hypothetical protein